jgi:hypothetical protein
MLGECFDRSSKGAMAMVAYRYPRILEDRYTAFRQILPELPETYGKGEADVEGKKAMDRLAHVAAGGSFECHLRSSHFWRLHQLLPGKTRTADARHALPVCERESRLRYVIHDGMAPRARARSWVHRIGRVKASLIRGIECFGAVNINEYF